MKTSPHWYLIQYDIGSPRRCRQVHRLLKSCAFALQESVFAWFGDQTELTALQQQLTQRINPKEDGIRGYRLHYPLLLFGELPFTPDA
jgi:CRISPR-associated endonuclease Cas2